MSCTYIQVKIYCWLRRFLWAVMNFRLQPEQCPRRGLVLPLPDVLLQAVSDSSSFPATAGCAWPQCKNLTAFVWDSGNPSSPMFRLCDTCPPQTLVLHILLLVLEQCLWSALPGMSTVSVVEGCRLLIMKKGQGDSLWETMLLFCLRVYRWPAYYFWGSR